MPSQDVPQSAWMIERNHLTDCFLLCCVGREFRWTRDIKAALRFADEQSARQIQQMAGLGHVVLIAY